MYLPKSDDLRCKRYEKKVDTEVLEQAPQYLKQHLPTFQLDYKKFKLNETKTRQNL